MHTYTQTLHTHIHTNTHTHIHTYTVWKVAPAAIAHPRALPLAGRGQTARGLSAYHEDNLLQGEALPPLPNHTDASVGLPAHHPRRPCTHTCPRPRQPQVRRPAPAPPRTCPGPARGAGAAAGEARGGLLRAGSDRRDKRLQWLRYGHDWSW